MHSLFILLAELMLNILCMFLEGFPHCFSFLTESLILLHQLVEALLPAILMLFFFFIFIILPLFDVLESFRINFLNNLFVLFECSDDFFSYL